MLRFIGIRENIKEKLSASSSQGWKLKKEIELIVSSARSYILPQVGMNYFISLNVKESRC